MATINHSAREITLKIVYYGPGLSGKTTNLEYIHRKLPGERKGRLLSLETDRERTIFFDLLPVQVGNIKGYRVKLQLFTVPGQIKYEETRRLVLRNADGIVFVADSQASMMDFNIESFKSMQQNLKANGIDFEEIPLVIQYNKQDLDNLIPVEELEAKLNVRKVPSFKSVATEGKGVIETFQTILKLVISKLDKEIDSGVRPVRPARSWASIGQDRVKVQMEPRPMKELSRETSKQEKGAAETAGAQQETTVASLSQELVKAQLKIMKDIKDNVDRLVNDNRKIGIILKRILTEISDLGKKVDSGTGKT